MDPDAGGDAMLFEGIKVTKRVMASKSGAEMGRAAAVTVSDRLRSLEMPKEGCSIDLWEWVRHEVTQSVSAAMYGPENPYRDPTVESCFW